MATSRAEMPELLRHRRQQHQERIIIIKMIILLSQEPSLINEVKPSLAVSSEEEQQGGLHRINNSVSVSLNREPRQPARCIVSFGSPSKQFLARQREEFVVV